MLYARLAPRFSKRAIFQSPPLQRYNYTTMGTSLPSNAASIAAAFLSRFQSQGPQIRNQLLDANQLHLLSLTLNRPSLYPGTASTTSSSTSPSSSSSEPPSDGTPLPPGYHLVYFTPAFLENELGLDGTDTSYNPDTPFTRRMWAGGEVTWPRAANGKPNLLRVGQEVTETTKVLSAEPKVVRKTGEAMIVVGVEKTFSNEDGVAVIDRRNWVFREALPCPPKSKTRDNTTTPPSPIAQQNKLPDSVAQEADGMYRRRFMQTPVTLFRFSALTFNPHKIHYSLPWAQDVEGHRNIVVHGPMNLILMLDFWRDLQYEHTGKDSADIYSRIPQSIAYRATNPLYADEEYEIVLEKASGSSIVNILDHNGVVSMKADIKG